MKEIDLNTTTGIPTGQTDSTDPSYKSLPELAEATADNIFIRLPTDTELEAANVTKSGIILGYRASKQGLFYDVLAIGPSVSRCKVGDKIMVEPNKLNSPNAHVIGNYAFMVIRDYDVLAIVK